MTVQSVCLFPLPNSITLNKISIPYHIFEPRYIKMVQDCYKSDKYIAVLLPSSGDEYSGRICVAGRPSIIQAYNNGELDIVITGMFKCRLEHRIQSIPYSVYSCEQIEESFATTEDNIEDLELFKEFIWKFVELQPTLRNQSHMIETLLIEPESVINYTTLLLVSDPAVKSRIMETNILDEKIRLIKNYLGPKSIEISPFLPPLKLSNS